MKKLTLIAATSVAAFAAGPALAANHPAPTAGIVVGSQHGVLLVASPLGVVRTFAGQASIGDRITIAGTRIHVTGRVHRAVVRGVVLRHRGNLTFLSAARHVLVVRSAARSVASARDTAPTPGTVVQDTVGIGTNGDLEQENEQQVGTSSDVAVTAVVTSVGTGTVTITVNGQALTIPLPAGLTLPSSIVGTQVTLNLSFANGAASATQQGQNGDQGNDDQGDDDSGVQAGSSGTSLSITGASTGSQSSGHGGDHGGGGDD
jgi:hypothetical protein